jgi:membrane-bound lytic murein transglycosylase F
VPRLVGGILLVLLLSACSGELAERGDTEPPFVEAGDLAEITSRGQLRIILPRRNLSQRLPRSGLSMGFEQSLAEAYARELGLEPLWIYVESRDQMLTWLLEGKGDFVASNLTATPERRERVAFTVPVAVAHEQLVTRADENSVEEKSDLGGRRFALRRSSSFWTTVTELQREIPGIEIEEVEETVETEEILHRVARGTYDVTVADSNLVQAVLEYRDDLKPALDLTAERPIAWAVRPDSPELLASLDRFLVRAQLADRSAETHVEDLHKIKNLKTLRVLTRNTAATYFLWRGELVGFEYELVREFARRHGMRVEVHVPPVGRQLLPWLREGRGDLVAAALTPSLARERGGVVFSRPYNFVSQVIVSRTGESALTGPEDLAGREVVVRRSSSYWQTLQATRNRGIEVEIVAAPEEMETEEVIARVAEGEFDLTLADSHVLAIELTWRDDVRAAFALRESIPLAWAVRESNPELLDAVNEFIENEYRGLFYNVIYDRYFEDPSRMRRHAEQRATREGRLSPYDDLVRKYAAQYGFDWRLIVAMMFQESRFDPQAHSFAGARGLMQLLPRTAMEIGFEDLEDPETGIHAGIMYLDWLRERFEPDLPVGDRMWFTLAAYNAGAGHVKDARRLAASMGENPNRWFNNVEQSMLLLSRTQYYPNTQHGYCRCTEPVRYVREVRSRYNAYVEADDSRERASLAMLTWPRSNDAVAGLRTNP